MGFMNQAKTHKHVDTDSNLKNELNECNFLVAVFFCGRNLCKKKLGNAAY